MATKKPVKEKEDTPQLNETEIRLKEEIAEKVLAISTLQEAVTRYIFDNGASLLYAR